MMHNVWIGLADKAAVIWFWLPVGAILHFTAFLLVCMHCLMRRREAVSAILWMFIAWSFPIIGALGYLFFGVNRVAIKGRKKHHSDQEFLDERRSREKEKMPLAYWRAVHESVTHSPANAFARSLNAAMNAVLPDYPLLGGNRITPLVSGDETYPRMLDAIRRATSHIHLQTFILGNDAVGRQFLDLLKQKAESGVTVRLLYDRFGSTRALLFGLIRRYRHIHNFELIGWTQVSPIKRRFQVNLRNHRKLLIVDGTTAFIGGVNIHEEETTRKHKGPIRDYHFAVHGPAVQELQYSFLSDWYFMTADAPDRLLSKEHFPHIEPAGDASIRVINGGPTAYDHALTDTFFTVITSARKEILAVTPYLVPPPDILMALRSAALRGVNVRLVVPQKNNHLYAGLASRGMYGELLSAGVRIFERHPPFIHAKALIVDDAFAIVGTSNMDVRSLNLNYESNVGVFHDGFVNDLKRLILEDISVSDEISLSAWRSRPMSQKLIENFCGLMTPIL